MSATSNLTSSDVNVTQAQRWQLLEQLNRKSLPAFLPALVLLSLVAVLGLVGNALVLHVYGRKLKAGTTRCFVLSLALVDLLSCTIGVAGEITLLRFNYNVESDVLCRLITFIKGVTILSSGYIIVGMTIERYRRLCWITRTPMGERAARLMVVGACALGGVTAVPYLLLSGTQPNPTPWPDVYTSECVTSHSRNTPALFQAYAAVLLLFFIALFATLIGLYSKIALTVWRRRVVGMDTRSRRRPDVQDPFASQKTKCAPCGGDRRCFGCGLLCCFGERGCLCCTRGRNDGRDGDLWCGFSLGTRCRGRVGNARETPSSETLPHSTSSDASSSQPSSADLTKVTAIPAQAADFGMLTSDGATHCTDIKGRFIFYLAMPENSSTASSGIDADVKSLPSAHDVTSKIQAVYDSNASQLGHEEGRQPRNHRQSGVTSPEIPSDGDAQVDRDAKPAELSSTESPVPPAASFEVDVVSGNDAVVSTRRISGRGGRLDICESGSPSSGGARSGRTTLIIVIIGLALILCYLPFLITALVRDFRRDLAKSLDVSPVYNFFLRSYFAQAAVNPIIYGFLNVTFRKECKKLFSRRNRR